MKTLREKEIRILARRLNQIYDLQIAKTLSRAAQIEMYKEPVSYTHLLESKAYNRRNRYRLRMRRQQKI